MKNLESFQNVIFPLEIGELLSIHSLNPAKRYESLAKEVFYEDTDFIQRTLRAENLPLSYEMAKKLSDFYNEVSGSQSLFMVKDPLYSFAPRQDLALGDGVKTEFTLEFLPVPETIRVWVAGSEIFTFTLNDYHILELSTPPTIGQSIEIECEYNLPMRFNQEGLSMKPDKLRKIFYVTFTLE